MEGEVIDCFSRDTRPTRIDYRNEEAHVLRFVRAHIDNCGSCGGGFLTSHHAVVDGIAVLVSGRTAVLSCDGSLLSRSRSIGCEVSLGEGIWGQSGTLGAG